jgi:hypothetical protein
VFENGAEKNILTEQGWSDRRLEKAAYKLHNLYSSPSIIRMVKLRRMRWEGHAARVVKKMNAYGLLVGKTEGKMSLGRSRRR